MSRHVLTPSSPYDRIIVALDDPDPEKCLALTETLHDAVSFFKVGLILFASSGASRVLSHLKNFGKRVFCDLKVDDTPNTIEKSMLQWTAQGITLVTLRDNPATVRSAVKARGSEKFPLLLCVPLLSTLSTHDLAFMINQEETLLTESFLKKELLRRTNRLLQEGCDGFIASGKPIQWIREAHPDALIVTPGVRPHFSPSHEHLRATTPAEAITYGADFLVVGRPISQSDDPQNAVKQIAHEIQEALANPAL
jgi:orotidine-5'-phosphate decarboxylase